MVRICGRSDSNPEPRGLGASVPNSQTAKQPRFVTVVLRSEKNDFFLSIKQNDESTIEAPPVKICSKFFCSKIVLKRRSFEISTASTAICMKLSSSGANDPRKQTFGRPYEGLFSATRRYKLAPLKLMSTVELVL